VADQGIGHEKPVVMKQEFGAIVLGKWYRSGCGDNAMQFGKMTGGKRDAMLADLDYVSQKDQGHDRNGAAKDKKHGRDRSAAFDADRTAQRDDGANDESERQSRHQAAGRYGYDQVGAGLDRENGLRLHKHVSWLEVYKSAVSTVPHQHATPGIIYPQPARKPARVLRAAPVGCFPKPALRSAHRCRVVRGLRQDKTQEMTLFPKRVICMSARS
jgi:hypothetical protein